MLSDFHTIMSVIRFNVEDDIDEVVGVNMKRVDEDKVIV